MELGLTTEVIADPNLLDAVREDWHRLAGERDLPYSTPEWMLAFWHQWHAGDATLQVVVVRDGPRVVGIGPFYGPRGAPGPLGAPRYWLLGAGIGQRNDPLAVPGAEADVGRAFAAALADASPRPARLQLAAGDAGSRWAHDIAAGWPKRAARLHEDLVESAPQVTLSPEGYAGWLKTRSRNFRGQLKRRRRDAEARGASIRCLSSPAEVRAGVDALVRLHRERFASQGKATGLTDTTHRSIREAAVSMLATGSTRLWVADAGGEIVGAQLHLTAGDRMCFFNGGSSPSWERESLGFLLLARAVEDAHDLGLARCDLGSGSQPYKLRFADDDDPIAWRVVLPLGARYPLALAHRAPARARRGLVRVARRLPKTWTDRLRRG